MNANAVSSDREALRIAVAIEQRGEAMYRRARTLVEGEDMRAMLSRLETDENRHASTFSDMLSALEEELGSEYSPEANALLSAIAADIAFPGGMMRAVLDGQLTGAAEILETAIGAENDSLLFYKAVSECAAGKTRETLRLIIDEETDHLSELKGYLNSIKNDKTV